MDIKELTNLTRNELLKKCEEYHITRYKSKNKQELYLRIRFEFFNHVI